MKASELKAWREKHGFSQEQLAKQLNVHSVTVARWETDARAIPSFLRLALKTIERDTEKAAKKPKAG